MIRFTVLVLLLSLLSSGSPKLLASSRVKKCYNDGDTEQCTYSVIVLVQITTGSYNPERTVVSRVEDDGVEVEMKEPLEITLQTLRSQIEYDLTRLRLFNKQPREYVYYGPMGSCPGGCRTVADDSGTAIPMSSGFCCTCSISAQLRLSDPPHRGNPSCSITDSAQTSHCIKMNDEWYIGSLISASPRLGYTVAVTTNQGTQFEVTEKAYRKDNITVSIVAADAPYFFDIGGQVLLVPSTGSSYSLHVPAHMVTVDGSECNKVGVSYEAFFTQGGRCEAPDGTCLGGQIIDLLNEDIERGPARIPLYSMSTPSYLRDSHILTWPTQKPISLMATIEIDNVDEVYFAINYSTSANITRVWLVGSDDFQLLETGKLRASVVNRGKVPSMLSVSAEASGGGISIANSAFSGHFEVNEERVVEWVLHSRENVTVSSSYSIVVMVQSVKAEELDRYEVNVTSNPVVLDRGAQGGEQDNHTNAIKEPSHSGNNADTDTPESCTDCPWYNPICFLLRECFLRGVLQFVGTVILIITIGYLIVKGHALRFLKWCLKQCYSKKKKPKHKTRPSHNETVHITVSDYSSSSDSEKVREPPAHTCKHNPIDFFNANHHHAPTPGHANPLNS